MGSSVLRGVFSDGAILGAGCVAWRTRHERAPLYRHNPRRPRELERTIGHDAVLGDFVTILPGANVASAMTLAPDDHRFQRSRAARPAHRPAAVGAGAVVARD